MITTELEAAWRRAGQYRFNGALYEPTSKVGTTDPYRTKNDSGLAWECDHGHLSRDEAVICAGDELDRRRREGIAAREPAQMTPHGHTSGDGFPWHTLADWGSSPHEHDEADRKQRPPRKDEKPERISREHR